MRAMVLERAGKPGGVPLRLTDCPRPVPGPGEVRVKVSCCGVCRTDLHLVEGEVRPPRVPLIPGHQVVGVVDAVGKGTGKRREGDRVGISWLHSTCGSCARCRAGRENLCVRARFTGFHAPGGFAEWTVVPEEFCYPLPSRFSDEAAAPLLCAGILGYRALRLTGVGRESSLGLVGFGGSAHITLQVARQMGCRVEVATRAPAHRELARDLGAGFVGGLDEVEKATWDAAILFAPAGSLVPGILSRLRPAGTLVIAALFVGPIPGLNYEEQLFEERVLRSATASTRRDAEEFLEVAPQVPVRTVFQPYPLEAANEALEAVRQSHLPATAVLSIG